MKTILYTQLLIFLIFTTSCNSPRYRVIETEGYTIPMDSLQGETNDAEFIAAVDNYKAQVDSIANQVIGHSAIFMDIQRPQSLLSNYTSDLLCDKVSEYSKEKCDFAVMNIGGIRTSLSKGEITVGDIFNIFPFENSLCMIKLKGNDVKKIFESIASRGGEGVSKEIQMTVTPDNKIKNVTVNGKNIDDNRIYTIATIDYLANGNDGMDAFKNATERKDIPVHLRDAMLDEVKKQEAAGKSLNSKMDNRLIYEK